MTEFNIHGSSFYHQEPPPQADIKSKSFGHSITRLKEHESILKTHLWKLQARISNATGVKGFFENIGFFVQEKIVKARIVQVENKIAMLESNEKIASEAYEHVQRFMDENALLKIEHRVPDPVQKPLKKHQETLEKQLETVEKQLKLPANRLLKIASRLGSTHVSLQLRTLMDVKESISRALENIRAQLPDAAGHFVLTDAVLDRLRFEIKGMSCEKAYEHLQQHLPLCRASSEKVRANKGKVTLLENEYAKKILDAKRISTRTDVASKPYDFKILTSLYGTDSTRKNTVDGLVARWKDVFPDFAMIRQSFGREALQFVEIDGKSLREFFAGDAEIYGLLHTPDTNQDLLTLIVCEGLDRMLASHIPEKSDRNAMISRLLTESAGDNLAAGLPARALDITANLANWMGETPKMQVKDETLRLPDLKYKFSYEKGTFTFSTTKAVRFDAVDLQSDPPFTALSQKIIDGTVTLTKEGMLENTALMRDR